FSKSRLGDESQDWVRFGLAGGDAALNELGLQLSDASDSLASAGHLLAVRLSDGRAELWAPAAEATRLQSSLSAHLPQA
ncbi:hypothetical protein RSW36_28575, partial [Escherichia coli]|uniref:hypothetical protein n=1 Tax=Escherichia coli TaxID=562 RepID=UPI0028DFB00F